MADYIELKKVTNDRTCMLYYLSCEQGRVMDKLIVIIPADWFTSSPQ
jgi:hypothetical protein